MNELIKLIVPDFTPFILSNLSIPDTTWIALFIGIVCVFIVYKIVSKFFIYILTATAIVAFVYAALMNYIF